MFIHTTTITRPDTSAPFFYDTPVGMNPLLYTTLTNDLIVQGFLISVERVDSPDSLVLNRIVTCPDEASFNECVEQVLINFPDTYVDRNAYNEVHNHVMVQNSQIL
jgi:hypothetical protein